jgi:WD40 repeat protein
MPPPEPSRVFISYARKDGSTLAQRLQKDLRELGFDAWLDTQRIHVGATWSADIERALDEAEYVLALLTQGSFISEICRAEQLRALRTGKCVIPLKAQPNTDVPLHLEAKNYRDFTADSRYAQVFTELLADLHARNGIALKPEFHETSYVTVPPLPVNFVERPESLAALRDTLITDDGSRQIALTALKGMGGIGKTVLAQALCHDEVVQHAFPDGIIWITVGKEASMDLARMKEVGKALGDDLSCYDSEVAAKNQYRNTIRGKAALIVVDDVWKASDLEALRAENTPRSRLLFTTRDASIGRFLGAREHSAGLMNAPHSRELLASWAGLASSELPAAAEELIAACGRLPLALSVVGAMLRDAGPKSWGDTLDLLRNADLSAIEDQLPEGQQSFFKAVEVSFQSLKPEMQERYTALAVLLEDMATPLPTLQTLWNVDEAEARRSSKLLADRSLAQRDSTDESIRLHDLQLDYVRAQWPRKDKEALELIHGAIRLSSHVIGKDPQQFASQMVGRMLPYHDVPAIKEFTSRAVEGTRTTWLRPERPALDPPGTGLLRTLTGHSRSVNAVAVTPDGQRAVSASSDHTLKVWELSSGRELLTLTGHSSNVKAVAVTPDGQRAVSASDDNTLKVWDLSSGRELLTLTGHHSRYVTAVAVTPDGQRAVSASYDNTLKVWDLTSGCELHTLTGHSRSVNAVAVTPDGQRAVSASDDNTLKVWELSSGRELLTLTGHSSDVKAVAVTPDGQRAVSASYDHTLKVWDLATRRELLTVTGQRFPVTAVAVTPDGQRAVTTARYDLTLKVWDLSSGRELRTLTGHSGYIEAVAVTPDGQRAVSASFDRTLKVWDLASGRGLPTLTGHTSSFNAVVVTPDGQRAVSASSDNTLKVWDLASGRELHTLTGHSRSVNAVAVTPDGQRAVSASSDHTLKVWELSSGRELHTLTGHSSDVKAVAVTPDGQRAVSASNDETLKVWELASGRELRTLTGHTHYVSAVAVAPDGQRAVSVSPDNTVKLWNLETGEVVATFICDRWASCCAFSDALQLIVAGDTGGHLHFLRLEEPKSKR